MNNTNGFPPGVLLWWLPSYIFQTIWLELPKDECHQPPTHPLPPSWWSVLQYIPSLKLYWPSLGSWGVTSHLRHCLYFHVCFLKWFCWSLSVGTEDFFPYPLGTDRVSQAHRWLSVIQFLFVSKLDRDKWSHEHWSSHMHSFLFIISHRCCSIISSLFDSIPITYPL